MPLWKFFVVRGPPGEADMILNMTACFFSSTRWEHYGKGTTPSRQEVEPAAHEGTLLHYNSQALGILQILFISF